MGGFSPTKKFGSSQFVPGLTGIASESGPGVLGVGKDGDGVEGLSNTGDGIGGQSQNGNGVLGASLSPNGVGVMGQNSAGGNAIVGIATNNGDTGPFGDGVVGIAINRGTQRLKGGRGVVGNSDTQAGVAGDSKNFDGVWGMSHDANASGVSGHNDAGGWAGYFEGKVEITSDLNVDGNASVNGNITVQGDIFVPGADCAEEFDLRSGVAGDPGSVMIIDGAGTLNESSQAYDKRVAGVISGAGSFRPGLILDSEGKTAGRKAIALVGKVFCKADADHGAIEVGDLLTTSPTPGHAMKAQDPAKAFGAVIGKAMKRLAEGRGLIPILIALQ